MSGINPTRKNGIDLRDISQFILFIEGRLGAIIRDSLSDWLKDAGYAVETAATGEEALQMVDKKDFSIMVLDYTLPGKSGVMVLQEVKATKPQIKCIMITAFPSVTFTAELRELGALDEFLIKPVMMKDLEKMIKEYLAKIEAGE